MLQTLFDVAPATTWALLTGAASLLLAGFILLSHSLVRHKAYGDDYGGLAAPGRLEWTLRIGTACVFAGLMLWGIQLGWPIWLLVVLGAGAAVGAGLEAVAVARH